MYFCTHLILRYMNTLDIIILVPIVFGFVLGIFRGLIKEIASLAAIILGIYVAKLFSPVVSQWLINLFDLSAQTAVPVAYLLLFFAFVVALLIVVRLVDKLLSAIALGGLNKFLGGLFGAFKFALIVSVLLNVFDIIDSRMPLVEKETKEEAISYEPLIKLAPVFWNETLKESIETLKENIDEKTFVTSDFENI